MRKQFVCFFDNWFKSNVFRKRAVFFSKVVLKLKIKLTQLFLEKALRLALKYVKMITELNCKNTKKMSEKIVGGSFLFVRTKIVCMVSIR